MVVGPLVSCTAALDALAAMTLPDTAEKDADDVPLVPVPVVDDTDDGDDPPPQAVSTTAKAALPAA
jgi:hypothetical protein